MASGRRHQTLCEPSMTGQDGTRSPLPNADRSEPIPSGPPFPVRRWLLALGVLALAYVLAGDARQAWLARNLGGSDQRLATQLGSRPITSSVLRELVSEEPEWRILACEDTGPDALARELIVRVDYPECFSVQEAERVIRVVWQPLVSALAVQKSNPNAQVVISNRDGEFARASGVADRRVDEVRVKFRIRKSGA
jgi:hypothetical protein